MLAWRSGWLAFFIAGTFAPYRRQPPACSTALRFSLAAALSTPRVNWRDFPCRLSQLSPRRPPRLLRERGSLTLSTSSGRPPEGAARPSSSFHRPPAERGEPRRSHGKTKIPEGLGPDRETTKPQAIPDTPRGGAWSRPRVRRPLTPGVADSSPYAPPMRAADATCAVSFARPLRARDLGGVGASSG